MVSTSIIYDCSPYMIANMNISYVCSQNVTNYQHFGEAQRGKCPLHENIENRHEQEVKKAAEVAMAKVRADNPGLSDADLMVKVSDQVKQAEDARRGQAAAEANAFPYHMVGDVLRNRGFPEPGAGARAQPAVPPPPQVLLPAVQYVPPPFAYAQVPMFVQPVRPIQFVQPPGYVGPVPQQHVPQLPQYVKYRPLVAPWPRCRLYHPPNQYC